ncbi:MAG TPA: preprotein translocase subunit SecY [Steroidobacteraceae bacterium]|nr:preprotein translocase subunit SecY [Steroidobacteraceae bacterium]
MLAGLGKLTELKQRILFVIGALIVFRLGSFIPVPGVNSDAMTKLIEGQGGLVDMFNMFSGGALKRFSLFALGVVPYISASIIVQMFASVLPTWQAMRKEGESGRRKLTQYTRFGTVGLAAFQAFGIATMLQHQPDVVYAPGPGFVFSATVGLTAGTMLLMWVGEQITERGIGNGISMIILSGIVAGLPGAVGNTMEAVSNGEMPGPVALALLFLVVGVTAFVVFMERAQRRIPVDYAKRQVGRRMYAGQSTHLPFKINMSGVIPPIFASSLLLFPATLASFFGTNAEGPISGFMQDVAAALGYGQPLHLVIYAVLIIFFCFFYTALVFNARDTAENLKKSGAFVRGIRPGQQTAEYIDQVLTRLTLWGALYVTAVCLIPEILISWYGVPFRFGGTSLLIVVVVVMDFMSQLNAHMMSHHYPGLLKKANLLGYGRTGPGG